MCKVLSSLIRFKSAFWLLSSFLVIALIIPVLNGTQVAYGSTTTWQIGDLFVGVVGGVYKVYDQEGTLKDTISEGGFTTGCAFNLSLSKLYTTNFAQVKVVVFDDTPPHDVVQTIDTGATSPVGGSESIVFDRAGNFYVGHAVGNHLVHKYDKDGNLLKTFSVKVDGNGSDWIELSADQKTLFYTSEGGKIMRYDVQNDVQLPDFADIGATSFALRLLPPWDGSGGLLVANLGVIKRLNAKGEVVQTYDALNEDRWRGINLDPIHTRSFWGNDQFTGDLFRFNIETGDIEKGPISTSSPQKNTFGGSCVKGERTAGTELGIGPTCSNYTLAGVKAAHFDIVPGNRDNLIHLGSSGHLATAILSNSDFDAAHCIETSSLTFGHSGDEKSLHDCGSVDVNNDGLDDLYCEFVPIDTKFQLGDSEGTIKGITVRGDKFEYRDKVEVLAARRGVQIFGLDDVRALQIGQSYYFVANGENISSIELQVFDMTGRRVFESATTNGTRLRVSLRGTDTRLANGIYFYRVTAHSIDGQTIHGKIKMMLVLR